MQWVISRLSITQRVRPVVSFLLLLEKVQASERCLKEWVTHGAVYSWTLRQAMTRAGSRTVRHFCLNRREMEIFI